VDGDAESVVACARATFESRKVESEIDFGGIPGRYKIANSDQGSFLALDPCIIREEPY